MKKIIATIALASCMGVVYANEPVALNETQMDNVTAAGTAGADAFATAFGVLGASTYTLTNSFVIVQEIYPTQAGQITLDWSHADSWSEAGAL